MPETPIGKVTATERSPTSCGTANFWVREGVVIRPFDIVRIPHIQDSLSYAIVKDLTYITDSAGHLANFVSSDFGQVEVEPQNVRMGTTIAEAEILYNTKDIEMPVRDGAKVEWADLEGIRHALGLGALRNPIPAGYICMSNGLEIPVEFEGKYLLGPEGAHLNIAGISGLATKTTYAMFLMNSIQQRRDDDVTMIIFNVKGTDLLAIDEPSTEALTPQQEQEWKKCGLSPTPFKNVTYLYPFKKQADKGHSQSFVDIDRLHRQQAAGQAWNYFYDVESAKRRLGLLFSDIDDPNQTMDSALSHIVTIEASSWDNFRQEIESKTAKGATHDKGDIPVQSWRKFRRLLQTRTLDDIFCERERMHPPKKRHIQIREALRKLKRGATLVIDIAPLPSYLQAFVFGDVVNSIYEAILGGEDEAIGQDQLGTIVIFADELNKYAPKFSGKEKTLTDNLLEITERGRSVGVILFGAEQFRSGVHDRILGNCSTNVFGRTSPVEVEKCADYKHFPSNHKWTVQRLRQGELLLQHAIFKTSLIKVRFPVPAYFQPKGR
jgi:hypothetical protein